MARGVRSRAKDNLPRLCRVAPTLVAGRSGCRGVGAKSRLRRGLVDFSLLWGFYGGGLPAAHIQYVRTNTHITYARHNFAPSGMFSGSVEVSQYFNDPFRVNLIRVWSTSAKPCTARLGSTVRWQTGRLSLRCEVNPCKITFVIGGQWAGYITKSTPSALKHILSLRYAPQGEKHLVHSHTLLHQLD